MTKEELEKEKCRLERKLEQTEKDLADYQFNYPTIKELQEENAEAKEIIREYYNLKNFPCASGNSINMLMYENINHKAEAFLKE